MRNTISHELEDRLKAHKFIAPQTGWALWARNEGQTILVADVGKVTVVSVDGNVMILEVEDPHHGPKYLKVCGSFDSYDGTDWGYASVYEVRKETKTVTTYDIV